MAESLDCLLFAVHYLDQQMNLLADGIQKLHLTKKRNEANSLRLQQHVATLETTLKDARIQENLKVGRQKSIKLDIQKTEQKLYSVKTPRELDALNHQKAKLESDLSEVEDAILEIMEQIEETQDSLAKGKTELDEAIQVSQTFQKEMVDTEKDIKRRGGICLKRRHVLSQQLPQLHRDNYERILKSRGLAVAVIGAEQNCPCCSFEIPKSALATLSSGNGPVNCRECGVYLSWDFGNFGFQCASCGQNMHLADSARAMAMDEKISCQHCEGA
ncbi:MAG: hypothetical protein CVV64_05740 [Candidatus Wallbacteria bacterium HGW-Wallbacteria-1]|jgi:hypothetical protein|uniref:CT398-like coiled coil hairpin domain-containing protein n=1 Tax=Candidatus Wallbacteria bacterium HGW-Wallbacteria-1 TaxID=2013854 RepID=A0A2N1PSF5_9BACT|nr:MAG: hypothetical protein CVV64_05740 [Candidatus Wallbacteria bacterium HGW-Wallbacteria-1]